MREMWRTHGKPQSGYAPVRPYTITDIRQALLRVTKDETFTKEFYEQYILGNSPPDYRWLLAKAGMLVTQLRPGQPWIGDTQLRFDSTGATLTSPSLRGQPVYAAGLERGDIIAAIDDRPITSQNDLDAALARHRPGDSVAVRYTTRGGPKRTSIVLGENPRVEVSTYEDAGRTVTEEMRRFRNRWLASRSSPE
jgi:predicted metalloprotease with PDZ domain